MNVGKKWFSKISVIEQDIFEKCYNIETKSLQDSELANCMATVAVNTNRNLTMNPKLLRVNTWKYSLNVAGNIEAICRNWILNICQVLVKILRVIHTKILNDESFTEKRRIHANIPHRLDQNVWQCLDEHPEETIPKTKSHYARSNPYYFVNKELDIKMVHSLFAEYCKN